MTKYLQAVLCCIMLYSTTPVYAEFDTASTALTSQVRVSGQMNSEKFQHLLAQGFQSVIVNRPDHEPGNQITVVQLAQLAKPANVKLVYQPVISGQINAQDIVNFANHYNSLPKPVLLICKSGARSTALFNQARNAGLLNE